MNAALIVLCIVLIAISVMLLLQALFLYTRTFELIKTLKFSHANTLDILEQIHADRKLLFAIEMFIAALSYLALDSVLVSALLIILSYACIRHMPSYVKKVRFRQKREKIQAQLPTFIDIIALGMSAGISFDASLQLYCSRVDNELSSEINKTYQSYLMGFKTRAEALKELSDSFEIKGLDRFVDTVIEALAFGSPLSDVLIKQSALMRKDHQALIQEKIEKAPVKMLLPIGILILPAMLLCILGPLLATALMQSA